LRTGGWTDKGRAFERDIVRSFCYAHAFFSEVYAVGMEIAYLWDVQREIKIAYLCWNEVGSEVSQ